MTFSLTGTSNNSLKLNLTITISVDKRIMLKCPPFNNLKPTSTHTHKYTFFTSFSFLFSTYLPSQTGKQAGNENIEQKESDSKTNLMDVRD